MRKREYEQKLLEYLAKRQERNYKQSLNPEKYNIGMSQVVSREISNILNDFMEFTWETKGKELTLINYIDKTGKIRHMRNFQKRKWSISGKEEKR